MYIFIFMLHYQKLSFGWNLNNFDCLVFKIYQFINFIFIVNWKFNYSPMLKIISSIKVQSKWYHWFSFKILNYIMIMLEKSKKNLNKEILLFFKSHIKSLNIHQEIRILIKNYILNILRDTNDYWWLMHMNRINVI